MSPRPTHKWTFAPRFRRNAFGWKSQPAIKRVREAVSEITKVARKDPLLAAGGAVLFIEKLSPALTHVDSSSGAIGIAVNRAIEALVPIIAAAPADEKTREAWLERLFDAHAADEIPYIESLVDYWGELCVTKELASQWADRLVGVTRMALSPDPDLRGFFHGTTACLSALFHAGRYEEIVEVVSDRAIWPYKRWVAKALAALGKTAEAIGYAESSRSPWASDLDVDCVCEEILLSAGRVEEAYEGYGLAASRATTNLAWFRNVAKKYPSKTPAEILSDLVDHTPGEEGKWFAAAKDAGLLHEALELASRAPCDPKTLTRAARTFVTKDPAFAVNAGLLALHWLVRGHGYDITSAEVWDAYYRTLEAAERAGTVETVQEAMREIVASETIADRFVSRVLGKELGLA